MLHNLLFHWSAFEHFPLDLIRNFTNRIHGLNTIIIFCNFILNIKFHKGFCYNLSRSISVICGGDNISLIENFDICHTKCRCATVLMFIIKRQVYRFDSYTRRLNYFHFLACCDTTRWFPSFNIHVIVLTLGSLCLSCLCICIPQLFKIWISKLIFEILAKICVTK